MRVLKYHVKNKASDPRCARQKKRKKAARCVRSLRPSDANLSRRIYGKTLKEGLEGLIMNGDRVDPDLVHLLLLKAAGIVSACFYSLQFEEEIACFLNKTRITINSKTDTCCNTFSIGTTYTNIGQVEFRTSIQPFNNMGSQSFIHYLLMIMTQSFSRGDVHRVDKIQLMSS